VRNVLLLTENDSLQSTSRKDSKASRERRAKHYLKSAETYLSLGWGCILIIFGMWLT